MFFPPSRLREGLGVGRDSRRNEQSSRRDAKL
jgi:hypothetical protein